MSESTDVENHLRSDAWAMHLLGYLAAIESAEVRESLCEALLNTAASWPLPIAAGELLVSMLDQDLSDESPF